MPVDSETRRPLLGSPGVEEAASELPITLVSQIKSTIMLSYLNVLLIAIPIGLMAGWMNAVGLILFIWGARSHLHILPREVGFCWIRGSMSHELIDSDFLMFVVFSIGLGGMTRGPCLISS
jgi:hypothetical protein